jgi:hypothetical protein
MIHFRFAKLIFPCIAFGALALLAGCKDKSTSPPAVAAISEDDAADVVAASLGDTAATNGLSAQIRAAAIAATGAHITGSAGLNHFHENSFALSSFSPFGMTDTTFIARKSAGPWTFNYAFRFLYGFADTTLNFSFWVHGTYDTPRMSSSDSAFATWTLTGSPQSTVCYFNGSYTRDGSQSSKVRNRNSWTTQISIVFANVVINKSSRRIMNGVATGTLSGSTTGGQSVQYALTIVFNGSQTATVGINGTKTYTVDMTTGQVE